MNRPMQSMEILVNNPYQDIGQAPYTGFSNNLPLENPTVEEMNRTITSSETSCGADSLEPLFGTHLREAAGTVKKLFGR